MTEAREAIAESVVAECSYIQPTLRNEAQAHLRAMMRLAIQEYEAALSEAGWVVVPRDDDRRSFADSQLPRVMIDAGYDALEYAAATERNIDQRIDWDFGMKAVAVYRAMISAATPPAKGGE